METKMTKTKSQEVASDIAALLRARNSLIWVVTREEARVEGYLFEAAKAAGYTPRTWDVAQGVARSDGSPAEDIDARDPGDALAAIDARATSEKDKGVWIMRDPHVPFHLSFTNLYHDRKELTDQIARFENNPYKFYD